MNCIFQVTEIDKNHSEYRCVRSNCDKRFILPPGRNVRAECQGGKNRLPWRKCIHRGKKVSNLRVPNCSNRPPVFQCGILGKCVKIDEGGKTGNAIKKKGLNVCERCTMVEAIPEIPKFFERVYCVTLDRRPDRWQSFLERLPKDWPFAEVRRFSAIDGRKVPYPEWWKQGGGAWGCYRSHLHIIEQSLNDGVESVLLLEDDALFCDGFTNRAKEFLSHVPARWGMIYLGGQHLKADNNPPRMVNEWVYEPYNVNRTHAFALQGDTMRAVYQHLNAHDWHRGHHIDHHLGRFHQRRDSQHKVFCPKEWLVGQAESKSNISGRTPPDRFWQSAEVIAKVPEEQFVAVLGLHSSGSSCLAGVLYHLGIHLGNHLGGYYGNNPDKSCGFEAGGLREICEAAIPFPALGYAKPKEWIYSNLNKWITGRQREAIKAGTIAGGKYPMLCRMANQLINVCGDNLYVVSIERPIKQSIKSLQQRTELPLEAVSKHQHWLEEGKQELLSRLPNNRKLSVKYADLLRNPAKQIARLVPFLGITPKEEQIAKAVSYVDPSKRHIR